MQVKRIPILMVEESHVLHVIEDKGQRYCSCRGANDGSFMIQVRHVECLAANFMRFVLDSATTAKYGFMAVV